MRSTIASIPTTGVRVTTPERTLVDVLGKPDKADGPEEVWPSLKVVTFFDLDALTANRQRSRG